MSPTEEEIELQLQQASAQADDIYAQITEVSGLPNIPAIAMMLLARYMAEQVNTWPGKVLEIPARIRRYTEQGPLLVLAYYISFHDHGAKCWVDFDKNANKIRAEKDK